MDPALNPYAPGAGTQPPELTGRAYLQENARIALTRTRNGLLKDKSVDGGKVLTSTTLEHLPAHDGPKVVYAAGCRFSKARLEREGITFKQTPYAIRTK